MKTTLYQQFKKKGYNFFVGVPCSGIKEFIEDIQKDPHQLYLPATKECTAVAMAFGAALSGKKPLVYMQSSGLGNVVNIATSLLHVYGVSIDFLVSDRKEPVEHFYMHQIMKKLIRLLAYDKHVTIVKQTV